MPRLVYNVGAFGENAFEIEGTPAIIGRADDCEVRILHTSLSRHHARIEPGPDGRVAVADLQSKNGTFVNSVRVDRKELEGGDVIQLGDLVFTFISDEPGTPAPVSAAARPTMVMSLPRSSIEELLGDSQAGALRIRPAEPSLRARDKLRVLLEISQRLAAPGDLDGMLGQILDLAFQVFDLDRAAILLVDPETQKLAPRVSRGKLTGTGAVHSQNIVDYVRKKGLAALFSDASLDPRVAAAASVIHHSIKSSMCAPLRPRDEIIGVLYVDNLSIPARFSEEDLGFLVAFANLAALAIDAALMRERLERAAVAQMRLLMEAKLAVLDAAVTAVVQEIKRPLDFVGNFAQLSRELTADLGARITEERERLSPEAAADIDELIGFLRENAGKIEVHTHHAGRIVQGVLAQAQSRSGRRDACDLNTLLAESVSVSCRRALHEHGLAIEVDAAYDAGIGPVEMVNADLGRAFINLVDNACEAMERKRAALGAAYAPHLVVRTVDRGDLVEARIRDDGTGVAPEIADKIYTPFFTTKSTGEGAGLGLSMAYETVVHRHGGELRLATVPGEHAELIITLPKRAPPPSLR
jgi:signal transduction histidine kinase